MRIDLIRFFCFVFQTDFIQISNSNSSLIISTFNFKFQLQFQLQKLKTNSLTRTILKMSYFLEKASGADFQTTNLSQSHEYHDNQLTNTMTISNRIP